jgi:hypothetical protein
MASRRSSRSRRRPRFPDRIFALASPHSLGGTSLFEPGLSADATTVGDFMSDADVVTRAVDLLAEAGFEVLQATPLMINFTGAKEQFESAFGTALVAEERPVVKQRGIHASATFIDAPATDVPGLIVTGGTRFEDVLEGVALEEPSYLTAPTAFPPPQDYFHLDVPADVALGCNADLAHRGGTTGAGVTVAMVDTGWQAHPSPRAATASSRSCSDRAPPVRASTRTATAPASRRTCSPRRRTARCGRSRRRPVPVPS